MFLLLAGLALWIPTPSVHPADQCTINGRSFVLLYLGSSVLVTECGKSSPKWKCHQMMQKHLVFVNNTLKFQAQMKAR